MLGGSLFRTDGFRSSGTAVSDKRNIQADPAGRLGSSGRCILGIYNWATCGFYFNGWIGIYYGSLDEDLQRSGTGLWVSFYGAETGEFADIVTFDGYDYAAAVDTFSEEGYEAGSIYIAAGTLSQLSVAQ